MWRIDEELRRSRARTLKPPNTTAVPSHTAYRSTTIPAGAKNSSATAKNLPGLVAQQRGIAPSFTSGSGHTPPKLPPRYKDILR